MIVFMNDCFSGTDICTCTLYFLFFLFFWGQTSIFVFSYRGLLCSCSRGQTSNFVVTSPFSCAVEERGMVSVVDKVKIEGRIDLML